MDVTVLDDEAAVGLLDGALRAGRPEDDRITADAGAAGRLAGVCGGLPLALQITAALLKADPVLGWVSCPVRKTGWRGCGMTTAAGRAGPSVAAAFELSGLRLDATSARVFRLLPVNPGPDISTAAAAVLADLPVTGVRRVLAGLVRAHLAEAAPGAAGRWRMHDLLRLYAQPLAEGTRTPMAGSRPGTGCSAGTWTGQAQLTSICGRSRAWPCRESSVAGMLRWPGWMRSGPPCGGSPDGRRCRPRPGRLAPAPAPGRVLFLATAVR